MSSLPIAQSVPARPFERVRRSARRRAEPAVAAGSGEVGSELELRAATVRVGVWLGWASILVVLAGLALDVGARHRWLLVGATLAAAAGNTVAMVIPWREWLTTRRGRILLDFWCGGLIAFVAVLVVNGGSNFCPPSLSRGPVHRGRADRLASRLLARRERGTCARAAP